MRDPLPYSDTKINALRVTRAAASGISAIRPPPPVDRAVSGV
ncbi:hypothetical protein AB0D78_15120 [Streptomyces avermitilis]